MIKIKVLTLIGIIALSINANAAFDINARTAILQDYYSGEILFENGPQRVYAQQKQTRNIYF